MEGAFLFEVCWGFLVDIEGQCRGLLELFHDFSHQTLGRWDIIRSAFKVMALTYIEGRKPTDVSLS